MKNLFLLSITAIALTSTAMPLGLRTAVWSVAAANGRTVRAEVGRLLPEDCEESQLPEVMEAFSDLILVSHITNKAEYTEFRDWALDSGERADALAGSQMAWKSFAMDLSELAPVPEDGDLKIDEIRSSDVAGSCEILFSLENAEIGQSAVEARLKTIFGVEGTATLGEGEFSADGVGISLEPTDDGRIRATVTPPNGTSNAFFIRVRMK